MLQSLDTLIAIAVIMSIASLLVTIVVQIISSGLSLRGIQLARGLQNAGDQLFPGRLKASKELAHALLEKPNFAGIKRLVGAVRPEEIYEKLKRLAAVSDEQVRAELQKVTDAAALASTALSAAALPDPSSPASIAAALEKEKTQLSNPDLADPEKTACKDRITKFLDAQLKVTEALRLKAELDLMKTRQIEVPAAGGATPSLPNQAAALLASLSPDSQRAQVVRNALGDVVQQIADSCLPATQRQQLNDAIQGASQKIVDRVDTSRQAVEDWFNDAVDHAQQWFLAWTRVITVCIAIIMTFVCQWDAVEIFKQVSGPQSAMRDALVQQASAVIEKADGILPKDPASQTSSMSGGLLEQVTKAWNEKHPERKLDTTKAFTNTNAMRDTLLIGLDTDKANATRADFEDLCANEVGKYYQEQAKRLQGLANMGFEFFPKAGWRWGGPCQYDQHLPGMIIFAALLSLGAPFWFNLLKNLTNLRPALAKLVEPDAKPATPPAN